MKINRKVTFLASAFIASATFVLMEQFQEKDPSFLPVTELAPEHGQVDDQVAHVSGLKGDYPKFLTTEDVLKGEVELPEQEVDPANAYDAKAEAWAKVDLDGIRDAIPNNLFWMMSAPTTDETVLAEREAKREALKVIETKMMARRATEQEIRDYYSYQTKLSEDYVIALTEIINRYGHVIPDEDYSGQALARTLHLSKLQEMPSKLTQALEQRQQFLSERAEWMADKDAYRAKLEAQAAEANRALGKI
ncbi:hypothetical protein A3765_04810 [Oleiphilus sp. HI0130]|nr:hypothetical protein A3758_03595 [Oleiphilus sp. HI0118]KZZ67124.1 hypothetical protein A3765_04810 [Oleiphilus sp. HI0130]